MEKEVDPITLLAEVEIILNGLEEDLDDSPLKTEIQEYPKLKRLIHAAQFSRSSKNIGVLISNISEIKTELGENSKLMFYKKLREYQESLSKLEKKLQQLLLWSPLNIVIKDYGTGLVRGMKLLKLPLNGIKNRVSMEKNEDDREMLARIELLIKNLDEVSTVLSPGNELNKSHEKMVIERFHVLTKLMIILVGELSDSPYCNTDRYSYAKEINAQKRMLIVNWNKLMELLQRKMIEAYKLIYSGAVVAAVNENGIMGIKIKSISRG